MMLEHILGLVTFIVIVLALSLLLPTRPRSHFRADGGGDASHRSHGAIDGGDCSAEGGD